MKRDLTMKKTNAQIQADYRNSRSMAGESGEQRINTWVDTKTKMALKRMAKHTGNSQREILQQLICQADDAIADKLSDQEWEEYFGITQ